MKTGKKTDIMVIDDEELICWSLKSIFEKNEDFSVSCAHSACDAIRQLTERQYDIVITDLKLPDISGMDLLKNIRGLINNTPLIVMSAYYPDPLKDYITKVDVFRCVNKPFEMSEITTSVEEATGCRIRGHSEK